MVCQEAGEREAATRQRASSNHRRLREVVRGRSWRGTHVSENSTELYALLTLLHGRNKVDRWQRFRGDQIKSTS